MDWETEWSPAVSVDKATKDLAEIYGLPLADMPIDQYRKLRKTLNELWQRGSAWGYNYG